MFRGTMTLCLYRNLMYAMQHGKIYEGGMIAMISIEGLIAVISLVLTAFGLGYTIGSNKSQK